MKILLVKPNMGSIIEGYKINEAPMEPLSLGIIAGSTPSEHELILCDERVERINFDKDFDLVAITVDTFTARQAYHISAEFKKRSIPVVMGGIHVTLLPEEASLHADAIVVGDVETVWLQILSDTQNKKLQKIYKGTFGIPQEGVFPRRDIFKNKGYLPISLVQFSRGCKYNCSYCSVSKFFDKSHQCRNIEDVLYEIEKDKLKTILFVDDNMVSNPQALKTMLRELIPLKVKWASQTSIDMVYDREMLDLMAQSGCVGNLIGFESINVNTLKWFKKSPNLRDFNKYKEAIEIMRDYGFLTWASFMFGNDFDDLYTIKRTVEFAIKSKFTLTFFHVLMPYPGTEVYAQFEKENRLLYDGKWWNHPDYKYNQAPFIPKLMTADQLSKATIEANKDFYSYSSIASRLFDFKTNCQNLYTAAFHLRFNNIIRKTST